MDDNTQPESSSKLEYFVSIHNKTGDSLVYCVHGDKIDKFKSLLSEDETLYPVDYKKDVEGVEADKFYSENGKLKVDDDYSTKLMSVPTIKNKHRERIDAKIEEMLKDPKANPIELIKLQREKEDLEKWTKKQFYQQALDNLKEDSKDKPLIVKKLKEKIKSIL